MTQLSHKKRRSTPLLRALAYNISRSAEKLDLKQSADLLYSMTLLNFPEPVLLERIGNDIIEMLNTNDDRTAVIGSILTSIGLMRYKEPGKTTFKFMVFRNILQHLTLFARFSMNLIQFI